MAFLAAVCPAIFKLGFCVAFHGVGRSCRKATVLLEVQACPLLSLTRSSGSSEPGWSSHLRATQPTVSEVQIRSKKNGYLLTKRKGKGVLLVTELHT